MRWIRSCLIAFSMYSAIPVPSLPWKEEDMEYSLCFFPLVGGVITALFLGWNILGNRLFIGRIFYTSVACAIPFLITGGIHMDGFLDTTDACASHQSSEKCLEIMKDPHLGAFAVIGALTYFILYFGAFSELLGWKDWLLAGLAAICSRVLSGLAAVCFPAAKREGTLYAFTSAVKGRTVRIVLGCMAALCLLFMILAEPLTGTVMYASGAAVFLFYYFFSKKKFGGVTGDTEGWFLQVCELVMTIVLVLTRSLL
ncbi:adenosylcobinamide-GDP ribazoletransferase [Anaerolentibacter hominis]|uniref:adenosylcobinamide-GDP ribazoletransferase n=1 Tax=Anaerolentibacter hominis TaxID=3079009 RepID=UPI0031B7F179